MIATHASSSTSTDHLWAVVADVTAWPGRVPTFSEVTPLRSASGAGARYRVRQPGLAPATYEVTECVEGRSFTWAARLPGLTSTATHVVSADGDGSRLDLGVSWSGPLAPVVRLLLGRRTARMIVAEAAAMVRAADAARP